MLFLRSSLLAAALAVSSLAAQAATIDLAADGQWHAFTVSPDQSLSGGLEWTVGDDSSNPEFGSALNYTFTIAAGQQGKLTVVDGVFAGDVFNVLNNGQLLGSTSAVPLTYYLESPSNVGYDFDAALVDGAFSQQVFTLAAGSYSISGYLTQSVLFDRDLGEPLNATEGALKLSVSAVPEPSTAALVWAAIGVIALVMRRQSNR